MEFQNDNIVHQEWPEKEYHTPIGSTLGKITKLPSDGQKTKKLGINGHVNIWRRRFRNSESLINASET